MAEISNGELLDYLKHAISLETDVLIQEALIAEYKRTALQHMPVYEPATLPAEPQNPIDGKSKYRRIVLLAFAAGFLLLLISSGITKRGEPGTLGAILVILAISAAMVWLVFYDIKNEKLLQKVYAEKLEQYNKAVDDIQKRNEASQKYAEEHYPTWESNYNESITLMNTDLLMTRKLLDELYQMDYVFNKYRNLPALTSIYEYFITGRCESLSGSHGAYNMYEDEMRKETIITQLNTIIANLEQIKQNQYTLYQQVTIIQKITATILDEIYSNTSPTPILTDLQTFNSYHTELIKRIMDVETRYCLHVDPPATPETVYSGVRRPRARRNKATVTEK